jgi:hypothetical protein
VRQLLRLTDRLFGVLLLFFAVASAIGCIVLVATGHWARLPGQLLFLAGSTFLLLVRRRVWSTPAETGEGRLAPDGSVLPARSRSEDPGWQLAPSSLLPHRRGAVARTASSGGALAAMRYLCLAFSGALVSIAIVIASLPDSSKGSPWPWLLVVVGIGLVSGLLSRFAEQPLDIASSTKLFASYQSRFFLRIAFAESIALFAFTFTFLGAPPWIYYVGCAVALIRLWTNAAPTRGALERDQADVTARGSALSLVAALRAGSARRD